MTEKICESLKDTEDSSRSRVVHVFGIPSASSELTSLVCHVQEKLTEETILSIHSNSTAKVPKTDQDGDLVLFLVASAEGKRIVRYSRN